MKLYYRPGACSLAPHIVIAELGLPATYDLVSRDTGRTEDGHDFKTVNPNGYVPALEMDDGTVLTENAAILPYLGELAPGTGWLPAEGMARYRALEWLGFVNTELHGTFKPIFRGPPEAVAGAKALLLKRYEHVEKALAAHDFLGGTAPSIADAYLYVVTRWTKAKNIDMSAFPNLAAFMQRMGERPGVKKALTEEKLA